MPRSFPYQPSLGCIVEARFREIPESSISPTPHVGLQLVFPQAEDGPLGTGVQAVQLSPYQPDLAVPSWLHQLCLSPLHQHAMFAVKFPLRFSWLVSQIYLPGICGLLCSPICYRDYAAHIRIFSSPEYRLRLLRLILRTVLCTVVFLVFLAIVLTSEIIITDGENLPYS